MGFTVAEALIRLHPDDDVAVALGPTRRRGLIFPHRPASAFYGDTSRPGTQRSSSFPRRFCKRPRSPFVAVFLDKPRRFQLQRILNDSVAAVGKPIPGIVSGDRGEGLKKSGSSTEEPWHPLLNA